MKKATVKLFGSSECPKCAALREVLDKQGVAYEYIDAFADETQDMCDLHGVDELPHIEISNETGTLYRDAGDIRERILQTILNKLGLKES